MTASETPSADLFKEFDLACEFPHTAGAFAELQRYVRTVDQFLPHAASQQAIRIRAQLKRVTDPVRTGELEHELEIAALDATVTLPRVVWGGVLVSIFATYENGVRMALRHWQRTTNDPEDFCVLPRKGFIKSADAYASARFGVKLFQDGGSREAITSLNSFRNSFAHGSGLVSDLPATLAKAINEKQHPGVSIEIVDGQWIANARSAAYYTLSAERAASQFGDAVLAKCLGHHRAQPNGLRQSNE